MYLTLSYWTVSYRFDVMMINLQFAWQNTSEKLVYQGSASHAWQRFFIIKSLYSCYICNSLNRIPDIFVFFIITCRLRFCVEQACQWGVAYSSILSPCRMLSWAGQSAIYCWPLPILCYIPPLHSQTRFLRTGIHWQASSAQTLLLKCLLWYFISIHFQTKNVLER